LRHSDLAATYQTTIKAKRPVRCGPFFFVQQI
jgi:hypothetical protein